MTGDRVASVAAALYDQLLTLAAASVGHARGLGDPPRCLGLHAASGPRQRAAQPREAWPCSRVLDVVTPVMRGYLATLEALDEFHALEVDQARAAGYEAGRTSATLDGIADVSKFVEVLPDKAGE